MQKIVCDTKRTVHKCVCQNKFLLSHQVEREKGTFLPKPDLMSLVPAHDTHDARSTDTVLSTGEAEHSDGWGEQEPDESMQYANPTAYFFTRDKGTPLLVVLSHTERGWASRSTSASSFNHDYVSGETLEQVVEWLKMEARGRLTYDRREALEFLATPPSSWDDLPRSGYLYGPPTMETEKRVDAVLRHLELCCAKGSTVPRSAC